MVSGLWVRSFIACLLILGFSLAQAQNENGDNVLRPALTVSVQQVVSMEMERFISATGNIRPWQDASVSVQTSGLRLKHIFVDVGDTVRQGQLLAEFDDTTIVADITQAKAAIEQARANLAQTSQNANRIRKIRGTGAVSQLEADQALAAEKISKAQLASAEAALLAQEQRLAYTRLLAPHDGVISARSAVLGAVYNPGQELLHIIVQNKLQWEATVSGNQLFAIVPGLKARVHVGDDVTVSGVVRQLAPAFNEQTRQAVVYVDLEPGSQARAGMFVKGDFLLKTENTLSIPRQALVLRDGFHYVFVLGQGNKAMLRKIETGQSLPSGIEVKSGLQEGDRIIVKGAGFLDDGDVVRVAASVSAQTGR